MKLYKIKIKYPTLGVPISFLQKFNPNQFTILGITSGRKEFGKAAYPIKRYVNAIQHNIDGSISNGSKINTRATIIANNPHGVYFTAENSKDKLLSLYARILIKRND